MTSSVIRRVSVGVSMMIAHSHMALGGCAVLNRSVDCAERQTALRLQRDLDSTGLFSGTTLVGSCDDENPHYAVTGGTDATAINEAQGLFERWVAP
ncbi:MAG: hypothetical protein ACRCYU_22195, partial [Nocardioides sp.]